MNKPPIGRRFQPGQSGNPKGRPPDLVLSREDAQAICLMLISGTFADVKKIAKSKTCTPIETVVANALVGAVRRQEFHTLARILDLIFGKPKKNYSLWS